MKKERERVRHRSIKIIILQQIKIDPGGWTRSIASSIVLYIYIVAIADISLRKKTHTKIIHNKIITKTTLT